jgi:hypothetical protein
MVLDIDVVHPLCRLLPPAIPIRPTIMIAERAEDLIRQEYLNRSTA